jgi:hypothetical protein
LSEKSDGTLIKNFSISYTDVKFDLKGKKFPKQFFVNFNELGHDFSLNFDKKECATQNSDDVYVTNPTSGQPVEYDLNNPEALFTIFFYLQFKKILKEII